MAEVNKVPLRKSPIWPALLSALVAPGVGQIFNRDFAKGFFLITVSLGSLTWFSKVVVERLSSVLPGTPEQWAQDPSVLQEGIMKLMTQNNDMFVTFQLLALVVWTFSVLDAYFTAKKNLLSPAEQQTIDETDDADDR